jgi:putative ABC transport system permease protein
MNSIRGWLVRFSAFFNKERRDRELTDELESHLQMHTHDNLLAGMTPGEARRQAVLKLGGVEQTKENYRDRRSFPWFDILLQDVRFGFRVLCKGPGFTAVAILTLALGIGANTAVYSIVDAVLLRSLPFRDAGRLVAISETHPSIPEIGASGADFGDWQTQSHSFEGLAAYDTTSFAHATLMVHGEPQEIHGAIISHNLFPLLGIVPAMGRNFLSKEDELGSAPVVILSGEMWKTRFGADPNVLGQSLIINDRTYTIVGILRPGLRFPQDSDMWVPLGNLDKDDRTNRFYHPLFVIGRLGPKVSVSDARAEMDGIAVRLASVYPQTNHGFGVKVQPLLEKYVSGLRTALMVLWAAVGLVLLIACANVAGLLLARAASREGEMAVRRALGASRARLISQGLAESMLLGLLGGLFGLVLAGVTMPLLSASLLGVTGAPILRLHEIRIDSRVLAATLGVSICSGILFGILPAIRVSRGDASTVLRSGGHTSPAARRILAHRVAVAGEIALAFVVLISAGLLVRSLQQLIATSPGFRVDHLLTMRTSLENDKYSSRQAIVGFYQRLLPNLRALPGVEAVGTIDQTPLIANTGVTRFLVDGGMPVRPGDYPVANFRQVSPGYFQTMEIPLLRGRALEESDLTRQDPVLVINSTLAEQFFPGQNPVGRKLLLGVATGKPIDIPIVGVVGDVRDLSIDSPAPAEMYFAGFAEASTLVVRSQADPSSMAATVRNAVLAVDPSQPVFELQTGRQLVDDSIARQRFAATLLGLFSALALILATGGIYGVTSYAVAERTREIGVRVALGAQPSDVLRLVVCQEMLAAVLGIAIGIAAAVVATRLLSSLLYRVATTDPVTYGGVCLALGGAAFFACYIPARRATRVDPMVALRYE